MHTKSSATPIYCSTIAWCKPRGDTSDFQAVWRGTRTVRRQAPLVPTICKCRLVVRPLPPGDSRSSSPLLVNFRLAGHILSPSAKTVLAQYWFWFGFRCCIPFPYSHIYSTNLVLMSWLNRSTYNTLSSP